MSNYYKFIIYSGFAAFISLCITASAGILSWDFRMHTAGAFLTLFFAFIHVGLAVYKKIPKQKTKKNL